MSGRSFKTAMKKAGMDISPVSIETLWVNITRRCNQACLHCHVEASPDRTEMMGRRTIDRCLEVIAGLDQCRTLDITGGAPELHPDFEHLVVRAGKLKKRVVVRHNLTVVFYRDPDTGVIKDYLPGFFAENRVEVLASLPHFTPFITDGIRGNRVFQMSIEALSRLNDLGYGQSGSGLRLNMVYNHDGPVSSAERAALEARFKQELLTGYGVRFNSLLAVTNMPAGRFRSRLRDGGVLKSYMGELRNSFHPEAAAGPVCRQLISVGHDGRLYDCDFNQTLGLPVAGGRHPDIFSFNARDLLDREIRFGDHCFGCTAGGGSS